MIQIPVVLLEFDPNGHTIWVHGPDGATVLRIKSSTRRINVDRKCTNVCSHADLIVEGDIDICLADDAVE